MKQSEIHNRMMRGESIPAYRPTVTSTVYLTEAPPIRTGDGHPSEFRLARLNGELVLQGEFRWREIDYRGCITRVGGDWKTLETVDL